MEHKLNFEHMNAKEKKNKPQDVKMYNNGEPDPYTIIVLTQLQNEENKEAEIVGKLFKKIF